MIVYVYKGRRSSTYLRDPCLGSDFDQCVAHVLEDKLQEALVPVESAQDAVSCGFTAPTCALHNLYPISEGLRRMLTDHQTATLECMVSSQDALAQSQRSLRAEESATSTAGGTAGEREAHHPKAHTFVGKENETCRLWVPFSLSLTRTEYEGKCSALFNRSVVPVTRLLDDLDLGVDEIDEVVMVGGMTRTPHVREMLKSHLGVDRLNVEIDPDIVVAYGAATVAH